MEILRGIDKNLLTIMAVYLFIFILIFIGFFCLFLDISQHKTLNSNSFDQFKTKEKDCTH